MTRAEPPVTWLMPVKNGMPYLPLTLNSIAAQTYPNASVLVWDNGSVDGTLEALRAWIPRRIPGKVIQGRPLRLGPSLAALVEMADTEFCARIDADDINLPERLAEQVSFLSANPQVGIVGSHAQVIDENGQNGDKYIYALDDAEIRWKTIWKNQLSHPAVMFRRTVILAAGNYRDCELSEDANLWVRAGRRTQIRNIDRILIKYRRSGSSLTGQMLDWVPICRLAAKQSVEYLFPNISDPARAMDLWEVTLPEHWNKPVKLRHLRELREAAADFARETGQPANYFTNTSFFREQEYHLRRRILEKFGLGPAIRIRSALARRVKGSLRGGSAR